MVKTLKEMGIQLGERNAEKKCLEDMKTSEIEIEKLKLQRQSDVKKLQDLESKVKKLESDFKKLQVHTNLINRYRRKRHW